jgi:hypothetical protein
MTMRSRNSFKPQLLLCFWLVVIVTALTVPPVLGDDFQKEFVSPIEKAHNASAWRTKDGILATFRSILGGKVRLEGRMLTNPTASKTRLELKDGTVIVFDGKTCWMSPPDAGFERARFHSLTWPYFLAAPMKLRDPGAHLEDLGKMELLDREYDTAKLTFDAGVGDAPQDWYILYRDRESGRLHAMAYIVTYFGTDAPPAKDPHAITYENFEDVSGVPVATLWRFWNWSEEDGLQEQLGQFEITDIKFVTPEAEAFKAPEGAVEQLLPQRPPQN